MKRYLVGMNGKPTGGQWGALYRDGITEFGRSGENFEVDRTYFRLDAKSEVDAKTRVAAALEVQADELAIYREDEGWRWRPLPPA